MDGYGQYCPIALGAEVFAERWTPIILRNLAVGCERFGDLLDGAPGLSRSVLAQRLRRLEASGVLTVTRHGRAGTMHVAGPPWTVRALEAWGRLSPFAGIAPARAR